MKYYIYCFKNYAKFNGRASRTEYWSFALINLLISNIPVLMVAWGNGRLDELMIVYYLYSLVALLPGIAVAVRRMHDVGKSGWFVLIPIYNLVLALTKGDEGTNEFGHTMSQYCTPMFSTLILYTSVDFLLNLMSFEVVASHSNHHLVYVQWKMHNYNH